jgi:hypothetical protein
MSRVINWCFEGLVSPVPIYVTLLLRSAILMSSVLIQAFLSSKTGIVPLILHVFVVSSVLHHIP